TRELLGLDLDPFLREVAAFTPKFDLIYEILVLASGAIALLHLPFNGKAVAIPARNVVRVLAQHLLGAIDDILQDLVQRMADVEVAIGVGRPIVKHELLAPLRHLALAPIEIHLLPARKNLGLALRQAGAHGEICLGKKNCRSVVDGHPSGLAFRRLLPRPRRHPVGLSTKILSRPLQEAGQLIRRLERNLASMAADPNDARGGVKIALRPPRGAKTLPGLF